MADEFEFDSYERQDMFKTKSAGFNPALIVLIVVVGGLLCFLVGHYALYVYAQKTIPPKKKKPVSAKKLKRERLRRGVGPPGE